MDDRRKTVRDRTYLGGEIAFNGARFSADCLVRNLTPEGAKIVFSAPTTIPAEFDFTIPRKGDSRRVRIVWQREIEAGVVFLPAEADAVIPIGVARKIRRLEAERETLVRRIAQLNEPTC